MFYDVQLVDQRVLHGLIEHLLELHGIFSDGDMARHQEVGFLDDFALSADDAERLETSRFVVVHSLIKELLLCITEIFLSDMEDIVDVDLRAISRLGIVVD